jgi:cytochrome c oxidase subunit 3/cytochrome c oxidase subunit I+III
MSSIPYSERAAKPSGWWGMVVFVATETTLFGTLIGSYYDLRFKTPHWPPPGVPDPKVAVPLILLAVLVSTSFFVQLASVFARAGRTTAVQLALLVALVMQSGYLAMQIHLYVDDLHHFTPQGSAYGSIYFTMLGAHHAHVLVGILLELWFFLRFFAGNTVYRAVGIHATAFFWHAVNVLAVAVTIVQLSPSL